MCTRNRLAVHALVAGLVGTAWAGPDRAAYGPLPPEALALPAEIGVVVGVDAAALFASTLYRGLTSGEQVPDQQRAELRDGIAKSIRDIEEKSGVNPERDLDRAVLGIAGLEEGEPTTIWLLLGRFDAERIARAVQPAPGGEQGLVRKPLHGQTLLVTTRHGKPDSATVVIDGKCLVFGNAGAVEATLVSWVEGRRTLAANTRLTGLVSGLDPAASVWLAVGPSVTAAMQKGAGARPPFPIPDTLTMAGRLDGRFESVAEMSDEAAALKMADAVRGGLAAIKVPIAQAAPASAAPGLASALEAMQVAAEGRRVVLSSAEGDGGTAAIGVVAALAIPALLRARVSANEAATIGDTRTVISAETAYASVAQGYGSLSCLAEPASCMKGYGGPSFLDKALASATQRSGYDRAFRPGPAARREGTYSAFAYVSTPREAGKTGVRSFCGDSSGRVCFDAGGAEIVPRNGLCPASCTDLR